MKIEAKILEQNLSYKVATKGQSLKRLVALDMAYSLMRLRHEAHFCSVDMPISTTMVAAGQFNFQMISQVQFDSFNAF